MADLAPIDEKLAKKIAGIVRRLTSNHQGEVAATIETLGRVLQSAGTDVIHCVADRIEHHNGLTDAEMKQIFDAGVAVGIKKSNANGRSAQTAGELPSPREMAQWCLDHIDRLHRDKDRGFIRNMIVVTRRGPLSEKRQQYLEDLYVKTGGRLS